MGTKLETGTRISVLDGWRGLSILLVLVGHFIPIPHIDLATWGVELFFVLSGRLMADILFVRRAPLIEFYRRRLSRILPALVLFVVVIWFAARGTPIAFKPVAGLMSVLFIFNYAFVFIGHHVLAIDHTWSLCVEEHTYVLLGLLAVSARLWRWRVTPILIVGAILSIVDGLVSTALGQDNYDVFWRTDAHISSILFGCVAYLSVCEMRERGRAIPSPVAPVAFVISAAVMFLNPPFAQNLHLAVGTLALAIAVTTLDDSPVWVHGILNFAPLRRLGILSFSVYLWQQPFYRWAVTQPLMEQRIGLMLASVAVGGVSFYAVERPARRWLNSIHLGRSSTLALKSSPSASR